LYILAELLFFTSQVQATELYQTARMQIKIVVVKNQLIINNAFLNMKS